MTDFSMFSDLLNILQQLILSLDIIVSLNKQMYKV